MDPIRLRPHHLLDIVTRYKPDDDPDYVREPGGNNVRTFTRMISKDMDIPAEFIVGWDFICEPCSHLQPDGSCDQILTRHDPPLRMDDHNNPLDTRILKYLDMEPGTVMTVRQFLELVNEHVPGIEDAYAQPTEAKEARRAGLINGLVQLGIRSAEQHTEPDTRGRIAGRFAARGGVMIEIPYRELYAPAHFGNSYEVMYPGEMRELLAEAKFWGFNAYGDWFDAADLRNPANNPRNEYLQPQAFRDRKVSHFRTAGELGFDLGLVLTPNHVYLDQLRDDLRAETTDERYFGQLLCPSKPEARDIILENHRYLFETLRDAGVTIGSLAACPYDYGGCGCEACRPWIVTFGKLCLEIAELAEDYFPGVAARLVGWWWTDEDHAAFTAWADREAPGRFGSIARYIKYGQCAPDTSQPIPRGCASFAFVHIGYADAATPRDVYGPWGPTIAPNRLAKTASSLSEAGVQGYMAYSEGAFDDVNKALLAGLTSGRFGQPREVLEAYAERYLGAQGTGRTAWAEWMMQWGEPFQADTAEARRGFDRLVKGARRTWRLEQLESKLRLFEAHNEVKRRSAWDAERLAAASRFFAEQERLQRGIWGLGLVRHMLNERFHRPDWYAEWAALQSKGQADTATGASEA